MNGENLREQIENLRCPYCKSKVYEERQYIKCTQCERIFEVREGIPIFSKDGNKDDLLEMEHLVKQLESIPESKFIDVGMRFRLPNRKYSLSSRYSEQKIFRGFFERFPDLNNLRILDISCGVGREAYILIEQGRAENIYMIDISFAAVLYAKRKFEKFFPQCHLHFLVGDAHRLPFPDKFFDIVLVYGAAHHYSNFPLFAKEAVRVSRNICLLAEPKRIFLTTIANIFGWNNEYGGIETARFEERELIESFTCLGMKCDIERQWQTSPKFFERFADHKIFVTAWFSILQSFELLLPGSMCHSINVYATS